MRLGFIGTGEITKATVIGILKSNIKLNKISISKRNIKISKFLKKKNSKIQIYSDNQKILDNSDWVFLAITPSVGLKIINQLSFKKKHIVISFISTINMKKLKNLINAKCVIVRAIPLPPISYKKGPIPIYPKNLKVKNFFNKIGDCLEIKNEQLSLNFWSTSSLMAPYYELLNLTSKWLEKKGINRNDAQKYTASLFLALTEAASLNSNQDFSILVKNSQTPKGLNQQNLNSLRSKGFFKKFNKSLDEILFRLKKNK